MCQSMYLAQMELIAKQCLATTCNSSEALFLGSPGFVMVCFNLDVSTWYYKQYMQVTLHLWVSATYRSEV